MNSTSNKQNERLKNVTENLNPSTQDRDHRYVVVVVSDTKMFVEDTQVTHCLWRGRDVNKNGTISILEDASVNYCDRTIL